MKSLFKKRVFLIVLALILLACKPGQKSTDYSLNSNSNATAVEDEENSKEEDFANLDGCIRPKILSIYLDENDDEILQENELLGSIRSFVGELTAAENYNYYSDSAHPVVGPAPTDFEGNVFLYEGPDGLTLNMFANKDRSGNVSTWNDVLWEITVKNNNFADSVLLSDDSNELSLDTEGTNWTQYIGDWRYKANTDGGVIGPLSSAGFEIMVKMIDKGDVSEINFHSSSGNGENNVFLLDQDQGEPQPTVFFIKFRESEECETSSQV